MDKMHFIYKQFKKSRMRPGELWREPTARNLPSHPLGFVGGSQGSAGLRQESVCLRVACRPLRDVPTCITMIEAQETWIQDTVS